MLERHPEFVSSFGRIIWPAENLQSHVVVAMLPEPEVEGLHLGSLAAVAALHVQPVEVLGDVAHQGLHARRRMASEHNENKRVIRQKNKGGIIVDPVFGACLVCYRHGVIDSARDTAVIDGIGERREQELVVFCR